MAKKKVPTRKTVKPPPNMARFLGVDDSTERNHGDDKAAGDGGRIKSAGGKVPRSLRGDDRDLGGDIGED